MISFAYTVLVLELDHEKTTFDFLDDEKTTFDFLEGTTTETHRIRTDTYGQELIRIF